MERRLVLTDSRNCSRREMWPGLGKQSLDSTPQRPAEGESTCREHRWPKQHSGERRVPRDTGGKQSF